jgi:hypothetical protein
MKQFFFFIKTGGPQKSAGFISSAGFYEVKKIASSNPPDQFHGIDHRVNAP